MDQIKSGQKSTQNVLNQMRTQTLTHTHTFAHTHSCARVRNNCVTTDARNRFSVVPEKREMVTISLWQRFIIGPHRVFIIMFNQDLKNKNRNYVPWWHSRLVSKRPEFDSTWRAKGTLTKRGRGWPTKILIMETPLNSLCQLQTSSRRLSDICSTNRLCSI